MSTGSNIMTYKLYNLEKFQALNGMKLSLDFGPANMHKTQCSSKGVLYIYMIDSSGQSQ
jgi:hypothetical protein